MIHCMSSGLSKWLTNTLEWSHGRGLTKPSIGRNRRFMSGSFMTPRLSQGLVGRCVRRSRPPAACIRSALQLDRIMEPVHPATSTHAVLYSLLTGQCADKMTLEHLMSDGTRLSGNIHTCRYPTFVLGTVRQNDAKSQVSFVLSLSGFGMNTLNG